MRVLEGRKTFAKGLGKIEFKGLKKQSYQTNLFLFCPLSCILLFAGAKIPNKQINRWSNYQKKYFFFVLRLCLVA
jgi:hypothetical protein